MTGMESPGDGRYAAGMREREPAFCWFLFDCDGEEMACIRDRGHDDGVHEAPEPSPGEGRPISIRARTYNGYSTAQDDHEAQVVELRWPDGRVAQISGATTDDPRGLHVLVRVWPEQGTSEDGGTNITSFAAVLRQDGDDWRIESIDSRKRIK